MKIALIHDWLTGMRGGENCLEVFCELFPEADIYTLLHIRGSVSDTIERHRIITSFIQKVPFARKRYRYYLPLMPHAISRFDLHNYDLIISSSHCVAKGVIVQKPTMHVCYCHTPMRYVWELSDDYFGHYQTNVVTKAPLSALVKYLQNWDVHSSQSVDYFLANSQTVKNRIQKYYNRDADVIYPPVDIEKFNIAEERDNYYLVVSALVPYKRIDIAVKAFNAVGFPLKVIGAGHKEKTMNNPAARCRVSNIK
jgi:glycosyltransferase involved in cell wall biosynthesis